MLYFKEPPKDGAHLRNFLEKSYNLALFNEHFHKYFEMLLHAELLHLKTFHLCKIKDF